MSEIINAVDLTSKLIRCESITPNSAGAIELLISYLEPLGFKCKKINFGDELDAAKAEAKAWKTIWSAGQGVTTIDDDPSVKELVDNLKKEFISSIKEQKDLLDTYK